MALVHFTSHLKRFAPAPMAAKGKTVRDALAEVFRERPQLRSYVLDEQGNLRKHVSVFADGERLAHNAALAHRIGNDTELYIMQALSGGMT
jgi:molybdopterin synthase sulfur carrier subunit